MLMELISEEVIEEPKETDIFTMLLYAEPWTDKSSRRNTQGNGCSWEKMFQKNDGGLLCHGR